jgi:hypothetical protein
VSFNIMEVFCGPTFAQWRYKAQRRESGWLVTTPQPQSPLELIMADGMLADVRMYHPAFPAPAPPKAAPAAPAARPTTWQATRWPSGDGRPRRNPMPILGRAKNGPIFGTTSAC